MFGPHSAGHARTMRNLLGGLALIILYPAAAWAIDSDLDGIDDAHDNCTLIQNPDQRDTDNDGYGDRCDGDFNNDGLVNAIDLALFRAAFAKHQALADLNGDGLENALDVAIFKSLFGKPPGPSQVAKLFPNDASRFLAQASFGATTATIDRLRTLGYDGWLNEQVSLSANRLLPAARAIDNAVFDNCVKTQGASNCGDDPRTVLDTESDNFRYAWWTNTVRGNDQLRQRVAFALSEIFVVSDVPEPLQRSRYGLASFYDVLINNAFGNYRTLLQAVTLHPAMGMYLSHAGNQKADPANNIRPDENYAREVLQLFSIGVHKLNIDGTPQLDTNGAPIPTYDQATVEAFARVFTGWYFAGIAWGDYFGNGNRTVPMIAHDEYHDTEAKTLLNGALLPAGQTSAQDLAGAIDNIFNHPNVGPFISRLLIQRLVTSNPTPAYVARVATVFNDNGQRVRGDLRAVIRAILLDIEARNGPKTVANFGKMREPLIRIANVWRAFNASPVPGGGYNIPSSVSVFNSPGVYNGLLGFDQDIGQNVLRSPSVFNFFRSSFAPAGPARDAGLVAPEFQLATENNQMAISNTLNFHVLEAQAGGDWTWLNLANEIVLAANPDALLDRLNLLLTAGHMTSALRGEIRNHLLKSSFDTDTSGNEERARDAIALIINSPEYLIQQ